jgi:hypothetical protein
LSRLLTPKGINLLAWFTPSNSGIEDDKKRNKEKNTTTPSLETFYVFVRKERYRPPNLSPRHADKKTMNQEEKADRFLTCHVGDRRLETA